MGLTETWFVESWSVLDGIAFASLREADAIRVCVVLMPPDWRAVPIGNPSTARGADRYGFQEGFFFPDGTEVAFPDLDVIRELVRRAYLAGGLGLADPGTEAALVRPPEGLDASGAAKLLFEADGDDAGLDAFVAGQRDLLFEVLYAGTDALNHAFNAWELTERPRRVRLANMRNLSAWRELHQWAPLEAQTLRPELLEIATALPFHLPALNPKGLARTPPPRSLGDQLLLFSASRAQCKRLRESAHFIPMFIAADLLAAASLGRVVHPTDLFASALRWLGDQIPNDALARVDGLDQLMEDLIADIAIFRLTPNKRGSTHGAPFHRDSYQVGSGSEGHAQGSAGA